MTILPNSSNKQTLTHLYFNLMDYIMHMTEWISRQQNSITHRISLDSWSFTKIFDVSLGDSQATVFKCNFIFLPCRISQVHVSLFFALHHFYGTIKIIQPGMNSKLTIRTVTQDTWIVKVCVWMFVHRNLNHSNHDIGHRFSIQKLDKIS